jgi:hypothetical protein
MLLNISCFTTFAHKAGALVAITLPRSPSDVIIAELKRRRERVREN